MTTSHAFNITHSARRGFGLDLRRCCLVMLIFVIGAARGFQPDCKPDEWFTCDDGLCVTKHWRCDGEPDCTDGSDELNCDVEQSGSEDVAEISTGQARSDVAQNNSTLFGLVKPCENTTEFQCKSSFLCVPKYWLCDGTNDCTDNSDEDPIMCQSYKSKLHCEEEMFFCGDDEKNCIPERWKCDGNDDCPNGSDENSRTCPNMTTVEITPCMNEFQCKLTGNSEDEEQICVSLELVCNNKKDCPLGDDEDEACIDSCTKVDCKEAHEQCRGRPDQPGECVCLDGFHRVNGSCVDVDECTSLQIPPCSQICTNGIGTFFCECEVGYELDHSGNCKALSLTGPAVLYFSGVTEIRSREIPSNNNYGLITDDRDKVRQAIGVAYDSNDARVYWADVSHKFIASSNLDGADFRNWTNSYIEKPEFLALDYLGRNFYYSDSQKQLIGVCTIRGFHCQGVITTGVTNPRGIAVQPNHGLLAYSNWDDHVENHPHIGLAGMDGEDLVILVNDSIRWPNGLAFDMPSDRLFWGEAYYDLLESIRLDGTGRVSVKPNTNFMSLHPFSVAVFEDTIYWSDYGLRDIQSCHKFTGENHKVVVKSARIQTYGIQIAHELLEPPFYSPCNHQRCGQMCLIKKGAKESVCKCASHFRLVNEHDCIPEVDLSIPEVDVGLPTLPPDTTTSPHTSEWPYGSHGSDNHTTPSPVIGKIEKNSTLVNLSTLPPNTTISQHSSSKVLLVNGSHGNDNHTTHSAVIDKIEKNSTGVIIGVIVALICFILCAIIICCVWKKKIGLKEGNGRNSFRKMPKLSGVKELFTATDDQGEFLISYQSALEQENEGYGCDPSEASFKSEA